MKRRIFSLLLALLLLFPSLPRAWAEETEADGEKQLPQIIYVTAFGDEVFFRSEDFEALCRQATGHELQCISFSFPPPGTGSLWYDSEEGNAQLTPDVSLYPYHAPVLSRASFRPSAKFTGQAELTFTMTSRKEETVSGTLLLYVPPEFESSPEYTLEEKHEVVKVGQTVSLENLFPFHTTSSFSEPSETLTSKGSKVNSVTVTLPLSEQGSLWLDYGDPDARRLLPDEVLFPDDTPNFYALTFVPARKKADTVQLNYTVSSEAKKPYTGTLTLHFVENKLPDRPSAPTPEPTPIQFSDLEGWDWATPAVQSLASRYALRLDPEGPVFRPGDQATRMEVLHTLVEAAYPGSFDPGVDTFSDLPQDPQYARTAAFAFVQGLALGDGTGRLNPNASITRQDALVLIHRALSQNGQNLPAPGDLSAFSDQGQLAPYAREAAGVLFAMDVLQGNEAGQLNPQSPITRAEMAALIYRAFP